MHLGVSFLNLALKSSKAITLNEQKNPSFTIRKFQESIKHHKDDLSQSGAHIYSNVLPQFAFIYIQFG